MAQHRETGNYSSLIAITIAYDLKVICPIQIKTVADINPRTVVVVHAVGPVDMEWSKHPNITAIVWAGLPGQESGNALADVLFGDVNPSGRLPYTIAKTVGDYPVRIEKNKDIKYTEDLRMGYRWFESTVRFNSRSDRLRV